MAREVWITGYGLLSPIGEAPEQWWRALAKPGAWMGTVDTASQAPFVIHPIGHYALEKQVPKPGDQRAMGPLMQYGCYAAGLALEMAGVKGNADLLQETHLVAAAGGGERDWELDRQILAKIEQANDRGAFLNQTLSDGLRPTLFLSQLPNLFAGNISIIFGVAGSSRTFMGEEAAGVDAVRIAFRRIAAGQGDIFLVGGGYSAARPDLQLAYHAGNLLLTGQWQPLWQRPDAGIALGSAGAFLVLEARERAEKRGVKPRARLVALDSQRCTREPGRAAAVAGAEMKRLAPAIRANPLGVLSGASGRGAITREERGFLAGLVKQGLPLAVRGTGAALGHSMESAFLQNLVLATACLEERRFIPPLDANEPLETAVAATDLKQILVTSWGHLKGEGLALLEAIDG